MEVIQIFIRKNSPKQTTIINATQKKFPLNKRTVLINTSKLDQKHR
jgi:hypothetical protein